MSVTVNEPIAHTSATIAAPVTPRIVPALVGPADRVQTIFVPCFEWCVVDHLDPMTCLDDIVHYSDADIVKVWTLTDNDTAHSELTLNISSDPTARDPRMRAAHIVINDAAAADAYLTPDMSDEFADELIAFAIRVRVAAQIAREHNADAGQRS